MDRQLIYPGQILPDTTLLQMSKDAMLGLAKLSAALFGGNTLINGFAVAPSNPASLQVVAAPGEIYSWQNLDNNPFGSLAADSLHPVMKQGLSLDAVPLTLSAPSAYGQSVNYLIQIGFQEQDANAAVLPYFNIANPQQPLSGQSNNNLPQNTARKAVALVQAKAGIAAASGSQTTPAPDAGFVGAYVVTVNYGQSQITAGNISVYAGAPLLTETLLQKAGQIESQQDAYSAAVAGGTSDALTASFTPAVTATTLAAGAPTFTVRPSTANATTTPTFTPNPAVITPAVIVKGNGLPLVAGDIAGAGHWITLQWDATLSRWILLNPATGVAVPQIASPQVRQTVQTGALSNGQAACVGTGNGLQPTLLASAVPVAMTFAAGYNAGGQSDLPCYLTADQAFPAVAANNLSFLYANRTGNGAVTLGATLAPPQYGYTYQQSAQALLHFEGTNGSTSTVDDFGNPVVLYGSAQLDTSVSKFGSSSLKLNGSTDYAKIPSIIGVPNGSWSIRGWFNPTSVSGTQTFFNVVNVSGFGISLEMSNAKTFLYLSSTGSTWDIASGTSGSTALAVGSQYFVEITFDAVAGKYFVYVNGMVDQAIVSSAKICAAPTGLIIGAINYNTANTFFAGHVDEFEFAPYCDHPNGATYTPPINAKSLATSCYSSDWYSIAEGKMYSITGPSLSAGNNPTMTAVNRLYVGECQAGASNISSATAYQYNQTGKNGAGLINALGYGQTWQNVVPIRVAGMTYYNTTGKPITVLAYINGGSGGAYFVVGGTTINFNSTPLNTASSGTAIVPPGVSYSINVTGSNGLSQWYELR